MKPDPWTNLGLAAWLAVLRINQRRKAREPHTQASRKTPSIKRQAATIQTPEKKSRSGEGSGQSREETPKEGMSATGEPSRTG